jgi:hypothetical protein
LLGGELLHRISPAQCFSPDTEYINILLMSQVLYKRVAEDLHTVTLQEGPKAMTRELDMAIDFDLVTCRKNEENANGEHGKRP